MRIIPLISFIVSLVVLVVGLRLASKELEMFADFASAFIVLGGTLSAAGMSFQLNKIFSMFFLHFKKFFTGSRIDFSKTVMELIKAINGIKNGESLTAIAEKTDDHFLAESLLLMNDGVLAKDEVIYTLSLRSKKIFDEYIEDAGKVKVVGKYPPAFGMIGTTIGMIVLLANLGGEDAMKMIGPAMGVCLITTLYGSVVANLIFLPLGDNLTVSAKEVKKRNEITIKAVELIMEKKNPIVAAEILNSYLLPSHRVDWKEAIS